MHTREVVTVNSNENMLANRATGARGARPVAAALAVATRRAVPRAFSAKPPDKTPPTPEEEAAKQATQMRALDVLLEAQNNTGKLEIRNQVMAWQDVCDDGATSS